MKSFFNVAVAAIVAIAAQSAVADVIGFEDFDGGATNLNGTTNVFDFNAGGGQFGDVFGRVEPFVTGMPFDVADDSAADVSGDGTGAPFPTDSIGLIGQNSTAIFAMNDMDGVSDSTGAPLNNAVWSFDITSAITIDDVTIDLGALGDFEAGSTDGFLIEAQIDGGGYAEIFRARTDEAAFKDYRPNDAGGIFSDDDPLALFIDGAVDSVGFLDKSDAATGLMDSYTSLLLAGQSGTTLDIRVSWAGSPSGSEPMGLDNITINGTIPEPATVALLGMGAIALIRRRR